MCLLDGALADVRNEETHLHVVGLLQSSSILIARYSTACPATPVPLASPVAPLAALGENASLHYNYCD
jgi:hypothetical protein